VINKIKEDKTTTTTTTTTTAVPITKVEEASKVNKRIIFH
jgi:hypothetical protein